MMDGFISCFYPISPIRHLKSARSFRRALAIKACLFLYSTLAPRGWFPRRQRGRANSISADGIRCRPSVQDERIMREVRNVVTGTMIVAVIRNTSLATEHGGLFFSFEAFCPCKNATCRDAVADEIGIVRPVVECTGNMWEVLVIVVFLEKGF